MPFRNPAMTPIKMLEHTRDNNLSHADSYEADAQEFDRKAVEARQNAQACRDIAKQLDVAIALLREAEGKEETSSG